MRSQCFVSGEEEVGAWPILPFKLADDFMLTDYGVILGRPTRPPFRRFYFTILTATGLGALTGSAPTTGSPPTDRM
jgi:hypothetical protein